jgi:hypothetical protein
VSFSFIKEFMGGCSLLFHEGAPLKELTVSKQAIFLIFLIILVVVAGVILIRRLPVDQVVQTSTPSPDEISSASAAKDGTQAFFQIQIAEGKDAWLNRFCALSTENGCTLVRTGADQLWQRYMDAKTSVQVKATPLECVSDIPTEQVWKTELQLSEPLPGSNKTKDEAYVLVLKTASGWKFDRFLFEPEVQVLQTRQKGEGHQ